MAGKRGMLRKPWHVAIFYYNTRIDEISSPPTWPLAGFYILYLTPTDVQWHNIYSELHMIGYYV
jgi:hypothetical protein